MSERFGSYEVYEELGSGGLAAVHLARSRAIKNPVALKRMYRHIATVRELVGSFIDEARLARYLRHPGIARVYEFGKLKGTYFIAFEFVPGPTLQQLQAHCIEHVGRMPVAVVLEIAYQLCDALDHAHNMKNELGLPLGIVHRDVSPSNVIVSDSGQVKLIDFGLAKTKQQTVQSQAGVIKGKLSYVAPEYLEGKLDSRCDLWALGVVMHELLTGKRLFEASVQGETLERVRSMPIPPPSRSNPEVPPEVDEIVLTALTRDPTKRWQHASDMLNAIGTAVANHAGGRLSARQLVQWVEWVFSQKQPLRREDSGVSALHEILNSEQIEVIDDPPATPALSEAMMSRRRESVAMMPTYNNTNRSWLWIAVAAVLLAIAVLVYAIR